jgi:hypothetical protein
MTIAVSAGDLEQRVPALLDTRITAVRELAATRQALIEARGVVEAAERADATAYAACERSGWTTDELRRLGLDEPARRAPGRPRTSRSPRNQTPTAGGAGSSQRPAAGGPAA